jgi:hypothetical protein
MSKLVHCFGFPCTNEKNRRDERWGVIGFPIILQMGTTARVIGNAYCFKRFLAVYGSLSPIA